MKAFCISLMAFTFAAGAVSEVAASKTNNVDSLESAIQSVIPTNWTITVTFDATPFAHQRGQITGIEFRLKGPTLDPTQIGGSKWNSHDELGIWIMPPDYTFKPENPPVGRAFSGVAQLLGANTNCVVYQLEFIPGPLNWKTWPMDIKRAFKIE